MPSYPPVHIVAFDSVTPLPSVAISQAQDLAIEARHYLTATG